LSIHGQLEGYETSGNDLRELLGQVMTCAQAWVSTGRDESGCELTAREGHHLDDLALCWTIGGDPGTHNGA
jgi:hypothetical protein